MKIDDVPSGSFFVSRSRGYYILLRKTKTNNIRIVRLNGLLHLVESTRIEVILNEYLNSFCSSYSRHFKLELPDIIMHFKDKNELKYKYPEYFI